MTRYTHKGNGVSAVRAVVVNGDEDEQYRKLLPREIVQWALEEAPVPFTFQSLYRASCTGIGTPTDLLNALKGAMAMDLREVLIKQGVDPSTHPYIMKYGRKR